LLELYAQTRADELLHSGMDALQREIFVQMQFRIRQMGYRKTYPTALDEIICTDRATPVGRVLTDCSSGEMCLIDIAVVAEMQNQGIGTRIIQGLQQECIVLSLKLKLQVLKGSAAERLYQRLGFRVTGEDPLRRQMIWDGTRA